MTRENIFKIYLKVLSLLATSALLLAIHFIFRSNSWGWEILVQSVAFAVIIRELGLAYCKKFGYFPWSEESERISKLQTY